jgi:hypothetical protein
MGKTPHQSLVVCLEIELDVFHVRSELLEIKQDNLTFKFIRGKIPFRGGQGARSISYRLSKAVNIL